MTKRWMCFSCGVRIECDDEGGANALSGTGVGSNTEEVDTNVLSNLPGEEFQL